jgi:hypothetical protein
VKLLRLPFDLRLNPRRVEPLTSAVEVTARGGMTMNRVWGVVLGSLVLAAPAARAADWQATTEGLLRAEKPGFGGLCGVAVDHQSGDVLVNVSDRGFLRSADRGRSWKRLGGELKGRTEWPGCLQLDPTGKTRAVASALVYGSPAVVVRLALLGIVCPRDERLLIGHNGKSLGPFGQLKSLGVVGGRVHQRRRNLLRLQVLARRRLDHEEFAAGRPREILRPEVELGRMVTQGRDPPEASRPRTWPVANSHRYTLVSPTLVPRYCPPVAARVLPSGE